MEYLSIEKVVRRSLEATTLIADLRNFTPNLNASREDGEGINLFCGFLADFYADCLTSCLLALPPSIRNDPPLHVSSTGDGMLIIFLGEWHFGYGFLAAIIMDMALSRRCAEYNNDPQFANAPGTSYGIGIESGLVSQVQASPSTRMTRQVIDTYIGHCINVAARAEAITKTIDQANTIIADNAVEMVGRALFGAAFKELRDHELRCSTDEERLSIHDQMNQLNHDLCLSYINNHILKGVASPLPLYRLARSAICPGTARFIMHRLDITHQLRDDSLHLTRRSFRYFRPHKSQTVTGAYLSLRMMLRLVSGFLLLSRFLWRDLSIAPSR